MDGCVRLRHSIFLEHTDLDMRAVKLFGHALNTTGIFQAMADETCGLSLEDLEYWLIGDSNVTREAFLDVLQLVTRVGVGTDGFNDRARRMYDQLLGWIWSPHSIEPAFTDSQSVRGLVRPMTRLQWLHKQITGSLHLFVESIPVHCDDDLPDSALWQFRACTSDLKLGLRFLDYLDASAGDAERRLRFAAAVEKHIEATAGEFENGHFPLVYSSYGNHSHPLLVTMLWWGRGEHVVSCSCNYYYTL